MKKLKRLTILISFVGHPSMNGDYLNTRRFDALNMLVREEKDESEKVIVSIGHIEEKDDLRYYKKYYEMFLEIKHIAKRKVKWIDIKEDISISTLIKELKDIRGVMNKAYMLFWGASILLLLILIVPLL